MSSETVGSLPAVQASLDPAPANSPIFAPLSSSDNESTSSRASKLSEPSKGEVRGAHRTKLPIAPPHTDKCSNMDNTAPIDARALVRLVQCKQCSFPLRSPMILPCGNSICPPCLPERHKRENITYPMTPGRREGFMCPFNECGREHSIADCAQDVTLTKVIEKLALHIAEFRDTNPSTPIQIDEKLRPQTETELVQTQAAGTNGPAANSRVLPGGYLAATYIMAEAGGLRYDSEVAFTARDIPIASYRDLDNCLFAELQSSIRQELDCQLCWNFLYDPLTTHCGHTFCRSCVARILDHSNSCPVCRKKLHLPPGVRHESRNKVLQGISEAYCGTDLASRAEAIGAEPEATKKPVPLFVVTLGYPGMPTFLHVFEQRYRLMIRRVLETDSRTFGLVAHNSDGANQGDDLGPNTEFLRRGTLLYIANAAPIQGGRLLIECVGVGRFDVQEWHMQDGYIVADTERIEDIGLEQEERLEAEEVQRTVPASQEAEQPDALALLETMSTADLLQVSIDFVERMRDASAPWLSNNILQAYGQPPFEDASAFPYWFASVIPIADSEKYALLGTTSVRERLKITARWVRRIEAQRW